MPVVEKITKNLCDNLPVNENGQTAYWDRSMPGFAIVVGKRAKTFIVQKDIKAKPIRFTIGRFGHFTVEEAKTIAREKLFLMAQGINPKEEEKKKQVITLERVFQSYLHTRKNLSEVTIKGYTYTLNKYLNDWAKRPVDTITKDDIVARHAMLGQTCGQRTANSAMRFLRLLVNHANVVFEMDIKNPVQHLNNIKGWYPDKRRRSYIKPYELPAWWKSVQNLENDTIRDFLTLLLFTGLRKGEAERIKWSDVDFDDATLTIPQTKNGDPLILPLSKFLLQLFQRRYQRYNTQKYVFPSPGKTGHLTEPKKGIYRVIRETEIQYTCHDLRRTLITLAESMDISAYALKRLINHRIAGDITSSYIVSNHERLREPVERIAQYILETVNGSRQEKGTADIFFDQR